MKFKTQFFILAMSLAIPLLVMFAGSKIGIIMPPMLGAVTIGLCLAIGLAANHLLSVALRKMNEHNVLSRQMDKDFINALEAEVLEK